MGNYESITWDEIRKITITPTRIPLSYDGSIYDELKKLGIVFKQRYNILQDTRVVWGHSEFKTISIMADVLLPKGFGILKLGNNKGKEGYYLINDKHNAIYYMWTKEVSNRRTCGIERIPIDNIKREIDIKKCGLYEGWWLLYDEIQALKNKDYATKIRNYKNDLKTYESYTKYDSLMIAQEYTIIMNKYNILTRQVPAEKLIFDGITAPPTKLKSQVEDVFISS